MLICRQRVLCFMLLIWKRWCPCFKLRMCRLFDLDREGGARPGFPTKKPNYHTAGHQSEKKQNCCFGGLTGLQRQSRKETPKRKPRVPKANFKVVQDMAWKLLPMLLREHGPSRKSLREHQDSITDLPLEVGMPNPEPQYPRLGNQSPLCITS